MIVKEVSRSSRSQLFFRFYSVKIKKQFSRDVARQLPELLDPPLLFWTLIFVSNYPMIVNNEYYDQVLQHRDGFDQDLWRKTTYFFCRSMYHQYTCIYFWRIREKFSLVDLRVGSNFILNGWQWVLWSSAPESRLIRSRFVEKSYIFFSLCTTQLHVCVYSSCTREDFSINFNSRFRFGTVTTVLLTSEIFDCLNAWYSSRDDNNSSA
jgi:hypothetical protein